MLYKKKGQVQLPKDCFQFTAEAQMLGHTWPDWVLKAFNTHFSKPNSLWMGIPVINGLVETRWHLNTIFEGQSIVGINDWLIIAYDDNLLLLNDKAFNEQYELFVKEEEESVIVST